MGVEGQKQEGERIRVEGPLEVAPPYNKRADKLERTSEGMTSPAVEAEPDLLLVGTGFVGPILVGMVTVDPFLNLAETGPAAGVQDQN